MRPSLTGIAQAISVIHGVIYSFAPRDDLRPCCTLDSQQIQPPSLQTLSAKTDKAVEKLINALQTAVTNRATTFLQMLAKVAKFRRAGQKSVVDQGNHVPSAVRGRQTRIVAVGVVALAVQTIATGSVIQARLWYCSHLGVVSPEKREQTPNNAAEALKHTVVTHQTGRRSPVFVVGPKSKYSD